MSCTGDEGQYRSLCCPGRNTTAHAAWEIREDGSVMLIADLALGRSGGPQGSGVSTKVHSKGIAPALPQAGVEWQAASSLLGSLCVECSLSFFRPQELGDV